MEFLVLPPIDNTHNYFLPPPSVRSLCPPPIASLGISQLSLLSVALSSSTVRLISLLCLLICPSVCIPYTNKETIGCI